MCNIWRRKLPSNLSRAYIKQILTPRPKTFLWGKGKGLHIHPCHLHRRGDVGAKESPNLIQNHWSLANTELPTPLETERKGGSHSIWHVVPSIVPSEILRVGGEAICRVGWHFFFYANAPLLENSVCFSLNLKFPKARAMSPFFIVHDAEHIMNG